MALPLGVVRQLQHPDAVTAWRAAFAYAWSICAEPLDPETAREEVRRRDDALAPLDLYLASAGWKLWEEFGSSVERTSKALTAWWDAQVGGRAVLVLDGLSLRELPSLLQGAQARGYMVHTARATASELPADTTPFAKALGFGQRSSIANNGAGGSHNLPGARTESANVPWADASAMVKSEPRWVFWHHWPDVKVHQYAEAGSGLATLASDAAQQLGSEDFWRFVERLATGRRLVITGDHGYAASGGFPDVSEEQHARYLRDTFKAQRFAVGDAPVSNAVPPIELRLTTPHGAHTFVLGRRKWKVAGGYPVLSHGGLSILEVAVPFLEISFPD
jgi:hypothetical protein